MGACYKRRLRIPRARRSRPRSPFYQILPTYDALSNINESVITGAPAIFPAPHLSPIPPARGQRLT